LSLTTGIKSGVYLPISHLAQEEQKHSETLIQLELSRAQQAALEQQLQTASWQLREAEDGMKIVCQQVEISPSIAWLDYNVNHG
jgi:hypothetical protein